MWAPSQLQATMRQSLEFQCVLLHSRPADEIPFTELYMIVERTEQNTQLITMRVDEMGMIDGLSQVMLRVRLQSFSISMFLIETT